MKSNPNQNKKSPAKLSYKDQQKLREKQNDNIIAVAAAFFFVAVTAVFPMFITDAKYASITFNKTLFFWVISLTSAAAIFCIFVFIKGSFSLKDYDVENEPKKRFSVPEWSLIAFIALAFLSAAFAAAFSDLTSIHATRVITDAGTQNVPAKDVVWLGYSGRYEGFLSFLCYALSFFIIAKFYKYKAWHFRVAAGSSILVTLYGILQFMGVDIFSLFPFNLERLCDKDGNPLFGPITAYFRTTLGNINIVTAYCSFAVILFAALFAVSKTKSLKNSLWSLIYIVAGAAAFMMCLITGDGGDAGRVAIAAAMVILIPYWISDRERFGKILIVLSSWGAVYAGYDAYLSGLKKQYESDPLKFAPNDRNFLKNYVPGDALMYLAIAAGLLLAGLCLIFLLKKWAERPLKIAGIIFLPVMLVGGILFVLFMGGRWADNPENIIWQAHEILRGNFGDKFGSGRGWIWKNAFAVLFDRPILGSGPDTFLYALGDARQNEAQWIFGEIYDKAHNVFLQTAICMGIPALIAYVTFVGGLFASAAKRAFKRPVLLAFGAAALSYMIQSFFCVEVPITTPLVWAAFGVTAREIWLEKIGADIVEV